MTIVLSIGTSHPWNVAGVGRDVIVGERLDSRVFTAIAGVSAQDGRGAVVVQPVSRDVLAAQLAALPWDAAGAVRIGALPTRDAVEAVVASLRAHPWLPAVVDPVFAASGGGELGDAAARGAIRDDLARLGNVVLTPNLAEAATLLGIGSIDRDAVGDAAAQLRDRGALAVLLKGGHLDGDPVDALATSGGVELLTEPRIAGRMHGTGCTLAMALACELARGATLRDAVRAARAYVRDQIARH
ncbi:MAG TPA: bifunctional hydroxymethylpyrimidine kinase/phosphomethylpyrimidine kinase [Candidatus Binatia bacterium]|nr:bifunctional hydroxymethylpyrimidine kinase/phosphomethylpyrimidine kinase [Candidatus Binatia bacterium]